MTLTPFTIGDLAKKPWSVPYYYDEGVGVEKYGSHNLSLA